MSDIRCPMCGKSNPADTEICQHCGAQIQLKHFENFEDEFAGPEDQVSWLKDLQDQSDKPAGSEFPDDPSNPLADSGDEMPDWLSRIRERSRFEEQAAARAAVDHQDSSGDMGEEDEPEWIGNLNQPQPDKQDEPEDGGDWLGSLRSAELSNTEQPVQDEDQPDPGLDIPSEDQVMDRLSALGAESAGAFFDEPRSEFKDEYGGGEETEEETPSVTAEDDLGDWLSKLDAGEPAQEIKNDETGIPEWLGSVSAEEAPESGTDQQSEHIPDWLNLDREISQEELPAEEESSAQGTQAEWTEAEPAEGVPDWLKSLESDTPAESAIEAGDQRDEGKPDWLSEIEDEVFEPASAEEQGESGVLDIFGEPEIEQPPQPEPAEVPDWLSGIEKTPPDQEISDQGERYEVALPEEELPLDEKPEEKDSAPGFEEQLLTGAAFFSGVSDEKQSSEAFPSEAGLDETSGLFEDVTEETETSPQAAKPPFEEEKPDESGLVSPFLGGEMPDWLSEVSSEDLGASGSEVASTFILSEEKDMEAESPSAYPFSGENMPEWLSEEGESRGGEGSLEEPGEDAEIAPAQMPSWLQAMRPVEAVAPGKARSKKSTAIESAGPLAGLQDILPAEDLATQYRKPPVYSTKLRVSESQRAHADLLESILEQENQSKNIRTENLQTPKWMVRLIIAALLIGVLVLPMLISPFSNPLALSYPAESVTSFYQQVESLAGGAPVLVAFDYDPGFSGEMRFSAAGVLERLISKRARIASISTVAQGPVLGDDLLNTAFQNASSAQPGLAAEYLLDEQTINLGYLAGGLASLQEFAVRPKQAVQFRFGSGLDGETVWNEPALQGVDQSDDFAMVIVITDNIDTARSWIEQVQPFIGSTPMLMITSAQASPMLLPYLQSGQVQGMLSGMSGGMTYEKLAGSSAVSASYYNAYQYAMIMGVAFVLLGLVFKILVSLFTRRKAKGEA